MSGESIRGLALVALLLLTLPPAIAKQGVPDGTSPQAGPDSQSEAFRIDSDQLNVIQDALPPLPAVAGLKQPSGSMSEGPVDLRARWKDRASLAYALTFAPRGQITGSFGGIPVVGMYYGVKNEGVFVLTVDGQALVMGTYECMRGECSIVGEEVLGRPKSFLIFANRMTGTFCGTLPGFYPSRRAWITGVEMWARENLDPSRVEGIVSTAMQLGGK